MDKNTTAAEHLRAAHQALTEALRSGNLGPKEAEIGRIQETLEEHASELEQDAEA